ncbi:MAG: NAD(P)-dependent oxidoreductase [Janthinobacterium lividum]
MILLTHTSAARALYYGARAQAALERLGPVRLNKTGQPLEGDSLVALAQGVQVIVADRSVPAPASLFAALPDLVAFVRGAVDVRIVEIAAASELGVLVTQASPGFAAAVCELILGVMVNLGRSMSLSVAEYRPGRQPPIRMGSQIVGSTVGIIGYGTIGRCLAPILRVMGARVLVTDPHATVAEKDVAAVDFAELLAASDIVICLAVASSATANLLDAAAFAHEARSFSGQRLPRRGSVSV